jgi:hypothetical protein
MSESQIEVMVSEVNDIKEGLLKLIDVVSSINQSLKVISDNQNYLNGKLNKIMSKDEENETAES